MTEIKVASTAKADYYIDFVDGKVKTDMLKAAIKDTPQPLLGDVFENLEDVNVLFDKLKTHNINHVFADWMYFYLIPASKFKKDGKVPDRSFWLSNRWKKIDFETTTGSVLLEGKNAIINNYVVMDVETTGLSTEVDSVIQLSAVKYKNDKIVGTWDEFIKPQNFDGLSEFIKDLTQITDEQIYSAKGFSELSSDFLSFIGDEILIGHNLGFDIGMLETEFKRQGSKFKDVKYIDTLKLAKKKIPGLKGRGKYKLENLKKMLPNSENLQSHNALNDCIINGELYKFLKNK